MRYFYMGGNEVSPRAGIKNQPQSTDLPFINADLTHKPRAYTSQQTLIPISQRVCSRQSFGSYWETSFFLPFGLFICSNLRKDTAEAMKLKIQLRFPNPEFNIPGVVNKVEWLWVGRHVRFTCAQNVNQSGVAGWVRHYALRQTSVSYRYPPRQTQSNICTCSEF